MLENVSSARDRIGPGNADVLLLTKAGLVERVEPVERGEAPREFFYNFFGLLEGGIDARIMNTSAPYKDRGSAVCHLGERAFSRLSGISVRHHYLRELQPHWSTAKVLISLTDHFSLTMGNLLPDPSFRQPPFHHWVVPWAVRCPPPYYLARPSDRRPLCPKGVRRTGYRGLFRAGRSGGSRLPPGPPRDQECPGPVRDRHGFLESWSAGIR